MQTKIKILSFVVLISGILMLSLFQEKDNPLRMVDRATGLFAYFFIFLAILSSEYMIQMKKVFGKGFIAIHHFLAKIGILLMILHPIAFAFEEKSASVLVPVFYPLMDFLELAGRPAFYLIIIAVSAGFYRKKLGRKWIKLHYLNYIAFLLIFIHAWLIGTDLQSGIMQLIWITMALIVVVVFIDKHFIQLKKLLQTQA